MENVLPPSSEGQRQKAESRKQKAKSVAYRTPSASCPLPTAFELLLLPFARCQLLTAHCPLPTVLLPCRSPVKEVALHFPPSDVKLAAGATAEAGSVTLSLARKRPAHLPVPAPKHSRYQVADPAPRRNALSIV